MFNKFDELQTLLNNECLTHSDEDLSLLESAMSQVQDAWTDYMMSRPEPPTDTEFAQYHKWFEIVERF
jgi:hypothetical protein